MTTLVYPTRGNVDGSASPTVAQFQTAQGLMADLLSAIGNSSLWDAQTIGGAADAITGTFNPTITALTNGLTLFVRATSLNATTTPTFKADGTAAKPVVKSGNVALNAGDIGGAGHWLCLTYDSVLDKWVLENPTTQANGAAIVSSLNSGPLAGQRNRLINGHMEVDQRNSGSAQTFTAAAALAYCVDRWYGYCTGANVTGQQITGVVSTRKRYQFTGAASVTAIGMGQRIEQANSIDMAGTTATLSVDLANSLLTSVTWNAYYATTADAFGTLASPTRTLIATGTFTVNSSVARYSVPIAIPSGAQTGIEVVFSVGAQTSGTWTIGNVQLEPGTVATPFERRSFGQELALCGRYYEAGTLYYEGYVSSSVLGACNNRFLAPKRAAPTMTYPIFTSVVNAIAGGNRLTPTTTDMYRYCNCSASGQTSGYETFTASSEL